MTKPFLMSCSPEDTVADMKIKVFDTEGIPPRQQRFTHRSRMLMDDTKLKHYGIEDRDSIFLELPSSAAETMKIFIKAMHDKTILVSCSSEDTVNDIKMKVEHKLEIRHDLQYFTHRSRGLKDDRKLKDYGIENRDFIFLELLSNTRETMKIFIREMGDKTIPIFCSPEDTVLDIKGKVHGTERISPGQQRFTHRGRTLMNDRKLRHYGIEDRDSIFLLLLPSLSSARKKMEVYIRTHTGKTYSVSCSREDTFSNFKSEVQMITGISCGRQWLVFGAGSLRDGIVEDRRMFNNKILKDYGIFANCTLVPTPRSIGGGAFVPRVGFDFASMKSGGKKKFSQDAPHYRAIYYGFNLEGRCMNEKCEAFKQLAWSSLGVSRSLNEVGSLVETAGFNIDLLLHNTPCPLCKESMDPNSIVSCGFYLCRYTFEGYQQGEKSVIKGSGKATDRYGFEYHNGVMDSKSWTTLTIVVKELL